MVDKLGDTETTFDTEATMVDIIVAITTNQYYPFVLNAQINLAANTTIRTDGLHFPCRLVCLLGG